MTYTPLLKVAAGGTGTSTAPANGRLLIGNGTGYTVNSLTAGTGISITNGAGSVSIDATGGAVGPGTIGQVAYFNSTSSVTSETTTFAWDAANDALGIGAAPTAPFKLDVTAGDVRIRLIRAGYGPGDVSTNTAFGRGVLFSNTTGSLSTAVGYQALTFSTNTDFSTAVGAAAVYRLNGVANTGVGYNALRGNVDLTGLGQQNVGVGAASGLNLQGTGALNPAGLVDASFNSFVGVSAGQNVNSGSGNIAVGFEAGRATVGSGSGSLNIAVGYQALLNFTTGIANIAIGYQAGGFTSGGENIALGFGALAARTTQSNGVAVGSSAGINATATTFTGVGYQAGQAVTTGTDNTAFGHKALGGATALTGSSNTAVGAFSLDALNGAGSNNIAIGASALGSATTASRNVAVGVQTLNTLLTNFDNVAVGEAALGAFTGSSATAVGSGAASSASSATDLTAIGFNACGNLTVGDDTTAVGSNALSSVTSGSGNTAVGVRALSALTTGINNIAIGVDALSSSTTGNDNVVMGTLAGENLTTGGGNVIFGHRAGRVATIASSLVAVGDVAATNITAGTANLNSTAVGANAEVGTTSTGQNTVIGASAGGLITSGTNVTLIGYNAEPSFGAAINEMTLGNSSINNVRFGTASIGAPSPGIVFAGVSGGGIEPPFMLTGHAANYGNAYFSQFLIGGGTVGGIRQAAGGGTPLVYATTSDYRLKTDVQPIEDPLIRLEALKPCRFHFTTNPTGPFVEGFIAHEVQEIVPQSVAGTKDAVDAEGKPDYQGFDQGHLVPLLTAAMQKLMEQVKILQAEVTALKG